LHRFRRVPRSQVRRFKRAEQAYARVREFLQNSTVELDFRRSKRRPSSLGLEVRKDLVCSFDPETGKPLPLTQQQRDNAEHIGDVIGSAIFTYFDTDRQFL
jgi:hypothetical protein